MNEISEFNYAKNRLVLAEHNLYNFYLPKIKELEEERDIEALKELRESMPEDTESREHTNKAIRRVIDLVISEG